MNTDSSDLAVLLSEGQGRSNELTKKAVLMHPQSTSQWLIGDSHWTERMRRRILQASQYKYSVLITGPVGTGKALIARAIHAHSARSSQPFVMFRCGTHPTAFAAGQLFGHVAGSGPLARGGALGSCGAARGGTLLLDEVGELDFATQDRLLSLLRDKRIEPVGGASSDCADVRIIATSSRDLRAEVARGRFRRPLLYSLGAISVSALPLRERLADIVPLARHILARLTVELGLTHRSLTPAALALLQAYDWPGNVGELERVLEMGVATCGSDVLDLEDFAELLVAVQNQCLSGLPVAAPAEGERVNWLETIPSLPTLVDSWPTLREVEAGHLRATLQRAGQNLTVAARLLGLEPGELHDKLVQHRLQWPQVRPTVTDSTP